MARVAPSQARTAAETARLKALDKKQRSCSNMFTCCFTVNLLLLFGAVAMAGVLLSNVDGGEIARFDPYEVRWLRHPQLRTTT